VNEIATGPTWKTIIADGSVAVFGKLFFQNNDGTDVAETAGSDFAVTLALPTRDREAPNRGRSFGTIAIPRLTARDDNGLVGH
jgi:hypothetical protein